MNFTKIIVSLAAVRYTCNATERTPYFIGTPSHVRILSGIGRVRCGKEAMKSCDFENDIGV